MSQVYVYSRHSGAEQSPTASSPPCGHKFTFIFVMEIERVGKSNLLNFQKNIDNAIHRHLLYDVIWFTYTLIPI